MSKKRKYQDILEKKQAAQALRNEREICAELSRGGFSLQRKNWIDLKDIDRLQDQLTDYFLKKKQ
jgi:hypothetical protein